MYIIWGLDQQLQILEHLVEVSVTLLIFPEAPSITPSSLRIKRQKRQKRKDARVWPGWWENSSHRSFCFYQGGRKTLCWKPTHETSSYVTLTRTKSYWHVNCKGDKENEYVVFFNLPEKKMSKEEGKWVWLLVLAIFSIFEILYFLWISYNIKSRLWTLTHVFHKFCPLLQPLPSPQEAWVLIIMDPLQFLHLSILSYTTMSWWYRCQLGPCGVARKKHFQGLARDDEVWW